MREEGEGPGALMKPMPVQPYDDPGDYPIFYRARMEFGIRLPIIPMRPIVPCLNCGETLDYKPGMIYCDVECEQAFRFELGVVVELCWDLDVHDQEKEN